MGTLGGKTCQRKRKLHAMIAEMVSKLGGMILRRNSPTVRSVEQTSSGTKKTTTKKKITIPGHGKTQTTTNIPEVNLTKSIEALHDPDAYREATKNLPKEIDGRSGYDNDPTRFGDWEKNGRCVDF